jgi:hypothetical protein
MNLGTQIHHESRTQGDTTHTTTTISTKTAKQITNSSKSHSTTTKQQARREANADAQQEKKKQRTLDYLTLARALIDYYLLPPVQQQYSRYLY